MQKLYFESRFSGPIRGSRILHRESGRESPAAAHRPRPLDLNQRPGGEKGYVARMPRYFFHLYDDVVSLDEEGRDMPDLESARAAGVREARQMMVGTVAEGRLDLSHRIDIADESGAVLATVAFRDAVTVTG
jgi:hypothetical protein